MHTFWRALLAALVTCAPSCPRAAVTDTIRGQIADVDAFVQKPDVLAYGQLCAVRVSCVPLV